MPRLHELPAETTAFIDANIFLGHFLAQQPVCTAFLERVWNQEVTGVTSVLVLSEVRHGLLRAEVTARKALSTKQTLPYLQAHPEIIAHLPDSRRAMMELRSWPLRIVQLTRGQFWQACRLSERFGLLTNDALHVATIRAHRLRHLVSADHDFRRVRGVTLWHP